MWIYLIIHVLCIIPCYRLMRPKKSERKLGDSVGNMLCSIIVPTVILLIALSAMFSNAKFWDRRVKW